MADTNNTEQLLAALRRGLAGFLQDEPLFLVGFSGGRDSVSLLWGVSFLLQGEWQGQAQLLAAHLNHNLRGAEAAADEAFCRGFCAERGIEYVAQVAELSPDRPNLEQRARAARYAWFADLREQYGHGRPVFLLTAHHREDQAETVLLHLLRGAGTAGVAAMRGQSGWHLRPLLDVPRSVLEGALAEQQLTWRDDATNACVDYTRNFLRHRVLPQMRQLNPQADRALAQAAEIAAAEEDYFAGVVAAKLAAYMQQGAQVAYPWAQLAAEPLALRRRLVRGLWLAATGAAVCPLGLAQVDSVLALMPGGAVNISGAVLAKRRGKLLVLQVPGADELAARRRKSRKGQL